MDVSHARTAGRPVLAVVYDLGVADPAKIYACARPLCEVIFVLDRRSPYVEKVFDQVKEYAEVLDITGMSDDDAAGLVAGYEPSGVVTMAEGRLVLTAVIAERCGLPFHDRVTSETLTDKLRQREVMAAAGVQTTGCKSVRTTAEAAIAASELGLPVVIKPRHGGGSVNTSQVETLEQCEVVMAGFLSDPVTRGGSEFVVEEMLCSDPTVAGTQWGDYVSVESVVQEGRIQTVCVTGRFPVAPPFREGGWMLPATISGAWEHKVIELEQAALRAIGVRHGVTHSEIKLTPDGPRVIEVNGRVGEVADVVQRGCRFDLVKAAINLALGKPVRVPSLRYRQVAYQYHVMLPAGAREIVSVSGTEEVNDIPGVGYSEFAAAPGQRVDWREGTMARLGIIHGVAPDHNGVLAAVAEIDNRFKVEYV